MEPDDKIILLVTEVVDDLGNLVLYAADHDGLQDELPRMKSFLVDSLGALIEYLNDGDNINDNDAT